MFFSNIGKIYVKRSSDGAKLVSAVEYSLVLVSAGFEAGSPWTQQFLRPCLGCLEFPCRVALHRVKRFLFQLNCSWQSFRTGTLERSSSYLCLLIRGGCRVPLVCLLSPFRLPFPRIRASSAVQMKCCYWVHLTKPESDAQQWAHRNVLCVRGTLQENSQVSFHSWIPIADVH